MIYFIFLASLALVTCYLACHWRNMTGSRLRKQLVNLSTRWLVYLSCYFVFYLPCLQATGWLVYSLTCPLTMLLCLFSQATCSLVYSFTCPLAPTRSLVYFSTKKLLYLAFSINFAIFANCLIHMYHMFVEIIDVSYYDFIYWLRVKGARERFCLSFNRIEKSFNNCIK